VDESIPSGVAPYSLRPDRHVVAMRGGAGDIGWAVLTASGVRTYLANPLNRVVAEVNPASGVRVESRSDGATLTGDPAGVAELSLRYQRKRADGSYVDVVNAGMSEGDRVAVTVPIVRCDNTITGVHSEPLNVRSGVTCLQDATVTGPVTVAPGASLVAVGATIAGPIHARDARAMWLSGGRISGPVSITGTAGVVRVVETTVEGRLEVSGSAAGLVVDRSTVVGSASVVANSGRHPITLAWNRIAGSLMCAHNAPAPTDDGRPNAVGGTVHGQCRRL
jgi:hypothetical protein